MLSLTLVDSQSGFGEYAAVYSLTTPASGSNTFSITFTNTAPYNFVTLVSVSGADTTTPTGTVDKSTGDSATTASDTVSSATDGLCVDVLALRFATVDTLAADGGQTERHTTETLGGGEIMHGASTEAGAASVTMGWSWTTAGSYAHISVPINAAAGGGGGATLIVFPRGKRR